MFDPVNSYPKLASVLRRIMTSFEKVYPILSPPTHFLGIHLAEDRSGSGSSFREAWRGATRQTSVLNLIC
jgi:hypothetical protein